MDSEFVNRVDQTRIIPNLQFSSLMVDVISRGKDFRFRASGNSMSPFIKNDDVVTFCSINSKPICVGDVVAFLHPTHKNLIVHRVIAKKPEIFLIKADNAHKYDAWVKQNQIIGIVSRVERNGTTIKFGMGHEKWIISLLSHFNILGFSIRILRKCFPFLYRRLIT